MKKLILVLLLALYCPILSAQVELEGKFDVTLPQAQVWDGRFLAYTFRSSAFFYDTETDQLYEEPDQQVALMNYKKGLYLRKVDDKFQLRKLGVEEPGMPYLLSRFTGWFGDSFMGWEEVTGPNVGIYAIWYDLEKGVIARHKLDEIRKAVGFDPKKTVGYRSFNLNQAFNLYSFIYRERYITLKNSTTDRFGFFDLKLNRAFPGEFNGADPFFEGLAAVQDKDGLWGFIDTYGVTRIPFIYRQKPGPFHSGLAMVRDQRNQIGYIDQNGVLKIPTNYRDAPHFYKGKAIATRAGLGGYRVIVGADGTEEKFPCGNCLTQKSLFGTEANSNYFPQRDIRDFVDEGMLILQKGFQRVIINTENEVLTPEYGMIKDIVDGKAIVVEGRYLDNDSKQRFYLWDLNKGEPIVELSFTEF
jgi:hypothetical protein